MINRFSTIVHHHHHHHQLIYTIYVKEIYQHIITIPNEIDILQLIRRINLINSNRHFGEKVLRYHHLLIEMNIDLRHEIQWIHTTNYIDQIIIKIILNDMISRVSNKREMLLLIPWCSHSCCLYLLLIPTSLSIQKRSV
jgi:hypothetical protein